MAFARAALAALAQLTTESRPSAFDPTTQISIERKPLGVMYIVLCPVELARRGGPSVLATFYPIIFGNTVVLKPSELTSYIHHVLSKRKVLDDVVDVNKTAQDIVSGSFWQSGQACIATDLERVFVQRGVSEALVTSIRRLVKVFKFIDPLILTDAVSKFLAMIEEAKDTGAEVILWDYDREGLVVNVGAHIVKGVRPGMRLWDEESFGPGHVEVIPIMVVDTVEEAIEMVNTSNHSLTASVWTANADAAKKLAARLRSAYVNINGSTIFCEPTHPNTVSLIASEE
ncbi:ALDH-like protein [Hymenopellis radicata]|nr:ALDH-like protein [Hymenopellis radicata]